jgi:lysophospholipase L1-like esterase
MIVLGDSVAWGQGLLRENKFDYLVFKALSGQPPAPGECVMVAHSGATIGADATLSKAPVDGEVPGSYPTIVQQCESFADRPDAVDIVIVNGGINDVDARRIVNPLTDELHLREKIVQYCYQDMLTLLGKATSKFTNRATRIVVPGYYPILSTESDPIRVPDFLGLHGVQFTKLLTALGDMVFHKIYRQCALFAEQSSISLRQAVDEINAKDGGRRVRFAEVPFAPENAALAPQAWLWGIGEDLVPEDQVVRPRHGACNLYEPDLIQREICYRASVGHPNVDGARQFAAAVQRALV